MLNQGTTQIDSALAQAFITALPDMPVSADGIAFDPPDTGLYCALSNVTADTVSVTLGDEGEDEATGYFQIIIWGDQDTGKSVFTSTADTLRATFRNGRGFVYQDQTVNIRFSRTSPFRYVSGKACLVVQHYWRARIKRINQ